METMSFHSLFLLPFSLIFFQLYLNLNNWFLFWLVTIEKENRKRQNWKVQKMSSFHSSLLFFLFCCARDGRRWNGQFIVNEWKEEEKKIFVCDCVRTWIERRLLQQKRKRRKNERNKNKFCNYLHSFCLMTSTEKGCFCYSFLPWLS